MLRIESIEDLEAQRLKAVAKDLGRPKGIDLRNLRTMHASLMRRTGARPKVARDNMGNREIAMTLEGYSRTWGMSEPIPCPRPWIGS